MVAKKKRGAPRSAKLETDPAKALFLNNVFLFETALERNEELLHKHDLANFSVQTFRNVEPEVFKGTIGASTEEQVILRVIVRLGFRSVLKEVQAATGEEVRSASDLAHDEEVDEVGVGFSIEASFATEFVVLERMEEEALHRFFELNCVHTVWPFWRQHVFETLKRAGLPVPSIPLMAGIKRPPQKIKNLRRIQESEVEGSS